MNNINKLSDVKYFILKQIFNNSHHIVSTTAKKFGISSQAVLKQIKDLEKNELIESSGKTKGKKYKLKILKSKSHTLELKNNLEEDIIWQNYFNEYIRLYPKNIYDVCQYGCSEIINNAIEHSEGTELIFSIEITPIHISIMIVDNGIGIFNKIKNEYGLLDERQAILELTKGKVTTNPKFHTGEGIFFTSRIFDFFVILSGYLFFSHKYEEDDWLIEDKKIKQKGTCVSMKLFINSNRELKTELNNYSSSGFSFGKTHVPVKLLQYENENLVSRSQARRLLNRFDRFKEVFLDFSGIQFVGKAFVDEIFRVFGNQNPQINIKWVNANDEIKKLIVSIIEQEKIENERQIKLFDKEKVPKKIE